MMFYLFIFFFFITAERSSDVPLIKCRKQGVSKQLTATAVHCVEHFKSCLSDAVLYLEKVKFVFRRTLSKVRQAAKTFYSFRSERVLVWPRKFQKQIWELSECWETLKLFRRWHLEILDQDGANFNTLTD